MHFTFWNILGQAFKLWDWISSFWRKPRSSWKSSPPHLRGWPIFQLPVVSECNLRSEDTHAAWGPHTHWGVIFPGSLDLLNWFVWLCCAPVMLWADAFTFQVFLNLFSHQIEAVLAAWCFGGQSGLEVGGRNQWTFVNTQPGPQTSSHPLCWCWWRVKDPQDSDVPGKDKGPPNSEGSKSEWMNSVLGPA